MVIVKNLRAFSIELKGFNKEVNIMIIRLGIFKPVLGVFLTVISCSAWAQDTAPVDSIYLTCSGNWTFGNGDGHPRTSQATEFYSFSPSQQTVLAWNLSNNNTTSQENCVVSASEVRCQSLPNGSRTLTIGRQDGSVIRHYRGNKELIFFSGQCLKAENPLNRVSKF